MTEIDTQAGVRWDSNVDAVNEDEEDFDGANNSAKLFERSRIKALAGRCTEMPW